MKHKKKVKLARKMRTLQEIRDKVSIFSTKGWEDRKESIMNKVHERRR